jgi:outer membrane protein assembly complex protein YaeT
MNVRNGLRGAVLVCCLAASACLDENAVRVAALEFDGAQAFTHGQLRAVIETQTGGRFPWSRWRGFDETVFERDLDRLRAFYRDRGFDEAIVRADAVALSEDRKTVRLRIAIDEGTPRLITSAVIEGIDDLPAPLAEQIHALDAGVDRPRDIATLAGLRERGLSLLAENGYPHASLEVVEEEGLGPRTVAMRVRIVTGPETRFGEVQVNGLERTKSVVLRRALTFKTGDVYRASEVLKSQRRLNQFGAFEFAHIAPVQADKDAEVPVLPMVVTVAEGRPHRFEVGVGYGTEDRARASVEYRNSNFFGNGSQWLGNARFSKVLRGAGFGYDHPYLFRSGGTLLVNAGAWWTNETIFTSRSAGGQVAVSHEFGRRNEVNLRTRYRNEHLNYRVRDEVLKDLSSVDERIALGLDPVTGKGDGNIGGIELSAARTVVDNLLDPRRGTAVSFSVEHVAPWLGATFRYDEVGAEVRGYLPIGARLGLAGKVRYGTLSSQSDASVPFSERFFLGGSTNLRGWGRYEVSPTSLEGVPIGGRTFVETSAELRMQVCCGVGVVGFVDAGNVWTEHWQNPFGELRKTVGAGLRYQTVIGVIRGDIGYQLNPIDGLRIEGKPQTRRWRIHLSIGHAF